LYLISRGADVNANITPYDFASTEDKKDFLSEAGGKSGEELST